MSKSMREFAVKIKKISGALLRLKCHQENASLHLHMHCHWKKLLLDLQCYPLWLNLNLQLVKWIITAMAH